MKAFKVSWVDSPLQDILWGDDILDALRTHGFDTDVLEGKYTYIQISKNHKIYTPEQMSKDDFFKDDDKPLKKTFVFGSNKLGHHYGGAAHFAHKDLGAVWGIGKGFADKNKLTWAFPTLKEPNSTSEFELPFNKVSLEEIETTMVELLSDVRKEPEREFYLTKIGCGIAGFNIEDIAKVFQYAYGGEANLIYPIEFEYEHNS